MQHKVAQFLKIKLFMDNDDRSYPCKHVYVDFHGLKGVYDFENKKWSESELSEKERWAVETFIEDHQAQFDENYIENAYAWVDGE